MSLFETRPVQSREASLSPDKADVRLRVLFVIAAIPAALVALFFPKVIALPAASFVSLILAAAMAIYAYRRGVAYRSRRLTHWDLAGMLALIGFGAGAVSDPIAALELFGMPATR